MKNDSPGIMNKISENNLVEHNVYKAKQKYSLVYVNKELYKKIFKEEYSSSSKQKLEEMFSLTIEENYSNGEKVGKGYADRQYDESGIALSGNKGSGRAFFYYDNFNFKGDKTLLATSSDKYYSDGKACLPAALKEAVLSNVIAKDFAISNFLMLAVFDKGRYYEFRQQFQNGDDEIIDEYFSLREALEIRYAPNNELYRISNKMADEKMFSEKDIVLLCENLGKMEANKFIDRFLHGSWSAGNLSVDCNMIDFDTCCFVQGRHPQFSNTNKYKASYFGYEVLGQKKLMDIVIKYSEERGCVFDRDMAYNLIDKAYEENLKIRFCDILGLEYNRHYKELKNEIDILFDKFNFLSRQFLPNYIDLNVNEDNVQNTFIYDFSRLFQKYLLKRNGENDIFLALKLLINSSKNIQYEKVGAVKEIVEENFADIIVRDDSQLTQNAIKETMDIVNLLESLYSKLSEDELLKAIFKSYIINFNRESLYNNTFIFHKIYEIYERGKFTNEDINNISEMLIEANLRNYNFSDLRECNLGLKICEEFLYYFKYSCDGVRLVLKPFEKFDVEFAKVLIDENEYFLSYENDYLVSEKIYSEKPMDIEEMQVKFKINGNWVEFSELY